jgi:hypothetical protein
MHMHPTVPGNRPPVASVSPLHALVIATIALAAAAGVGGVVSFPDPSLGAAVSRPGAFPLVFAESTEASSSKAAFEAHVGGGTLLLRRGGVVLAGGVPGASSAATEAARSTVRIRFTSPGRRVEPVGVDRLPGVVNYLLGDDPHAWRTGAPTFGGVEYRDIHPGIDLRYGGEFAAPTLSPHGTYVVAPGADVGRIGWRYPAGRAVEVDPATGRLRIALARTGERAMTQTAPVAWQMVEGRRTPVAAAYRARGADEVGLEVGRYDAGRPLLIDLSVGTRLSRRGLASGFSTYLGGSRWDEGYDVDVDDAGNAYITGFTLSSDFPTRSALQRSGGVVNAFVTKVSADGRTLLYSTYLGGNDLDVGTSVAVDDAGNAFVTGRTGSTNFPTVDALQAALRGRACQGEPCDDAFVAKLDATGKALRYSTYLGGRGNDDALGIAVDTAGRAYVAGNTGSTDFPTVNAVQGEFRSSCRGDLPCPPDTFVAKLGASGRALAYSTYLGGSEADRSAGVAVDEAGSAYVTGSTRSPDFPTVDPVQRSLRGVACGPPPGRPCPDAFVSKLDPDGGSLAYSTYHGGTEPESSGGIAVDLEGRAYITGATQSEDLPTVHPLQPTLDNRSCFDERPEELCDDAFVTRLGADGARLDYSTYLGGAATDQGLGIAVDEAAGIAYVAGSTDSRNLETNEAVQPRLAGAVDAFVATLRVDGRALRFGTYVGGSEAERANAIAVGAGGDAVLTGRTESLDYPTARALQRTLAGDFDAFLTGLAAS